MSKLLTVKAPATIANLGSGYDVLSCCLHEPFDLLTVQKNSTGKITLINNSREFPAMPLEPEKNTAAFALQKMLIDLGSKQGFDIVFEKKIRPGSGLGSSAASACAAILGANTLLDNPFTRRELIPFAMQSEKMVCGTAIADNVASCLLGGVNLVQSYNPLRIIELDFPECYFVVLHPFFEISTQKARDILPDKIELKTAVEQWGNVGGLVAGFQKLDIELIALSMNDVVVEPHRASLISGFSKLQNCATEAGALNCHISGAGPSIFALCKSEEIANNVKTKMEFCMIENGHETESYISKINPQGVSIS